jgi:hypothetical protein
VLPGSYTLKSAYSEQAGLMTGRLPIDIGDTNVTGVVLTVAPSSELPGMIVIVGKPDAQPLNFLVTLRRKGNEGGMEMGIEPDGSFLLKSLLPEPYEVNVARLVGNLYLKTIKLGDTDVIDGGLDFTQGVPSTHLTLVLGTAGGQVEGIVEDDNQKPVVGGQVVLIPDAPKRGVTRLYETAVTDANGHYKIAGIAPSDYKLFAWEQVEDGAYQDPDFLKSYESRGEAVSVKEGSSDSKPLTVIPGDGPKA